VRLVLRYVAYLAFAVFAIMFWSGMLIFRAMGDPVCDPYPCPPPSWLSHAIDLAVIWGSIPITVVLFIPYHQLVRRVLIAEDE